MNLIRYHADDAVHIFKNIAIVPFVPALGSNSWIKSPYRRTFYKTGYCIRGCLLPVTPPSEQAAVQHAYPEWML